MEIITLQKKIIFIALVLLCFTGWINGAVALLCGIVFSSLFGNPFPQLSGKTVQVLLRIAIVGFGFGINAMEAIQVSSDSLILTISSILIIFVVGYAISKWLKTNQDISYLISTGTAICGGSAIAAVSPITKASNQSISIALGVVFLLNAIALFIFPGIGEFIGLSQYQFGVWSAIAIHDTSSVVGAAYAYGDEALNIATTVKMARVLWIVPISIVTIFLFKRKNAKIKVPWFIVLFILAILVNSYLNIPDSLQLAISRISKSVLIVTLFLIGIGLSFQQIKSAGWRVLLYGFILWMVMASYSLIMLY